MADALRGLPATQALAQLTFHPSKSARLFFKLIHSAVSNAKNNYNLKEDNLKIKTITVDSGPSYKRAWLRSHGSSDRLIKRTSNFQVVVAEIKPTAVKKVVASPVKKVTETHDHDHPHDHDHEHTHETVKPTNPMRDKTLGKASKGIKQIFTRNTTNK